MLLPLDGQLTTNGSATLTAALILGLNITRTGPTGFGPFVDTFDTAANIIAGFGIAGSAPVGTAIEFTYNNASNASITLAAGTGVTLTAESGASLSIANGKVATLLLTVTGLATVSIVVLFRNATS